MLLGFHRVIFCFLERKAGLFLGCLVRYQPSIAVIRPGSALGKKAPPFPSRNETALLCCRCCDPFTSYSCLVVTSPLYGLPKDRLMGHLCGVQAVDQFVIRHDGCHFEHVAFEGLALGCSPEGACGVQSAIWLLGGGSVQCVLGLPIP